MSNLKYRLLAIVGLVVLSVWFLIPRDVTIREKAADGTMRDTVVRRVPLRRGLDLAGGMYLALEIDDSQQKIARDQRGEALDRALKPLRSRIDQFGVTEPLIQKAGDDRIIIQLPGIREPERALQIVRNQAFLEFQITDRTRALEASLPRFDRILRDKGIGTIAPDTAGKPGTKTGVGELFKTADSAKRDSAKKGSAADSTKPDTSSEPITGGALSSRIQVGQSDGEYYVSTKDFARVESYIGLAEIQSAMPPGKKILFSADSTPMGPNWYRGLYVVDRTPIITGDALIDARPANDPQQGTIVTFQLNNEGGRKFKRETGKHVGHYMAIVLDGRVMGRPPVIQTAIGTRGQITMGNKGIEEAQDLALVLRAGALPVPLRVAEVKNIGPSLGQDSIDKGIRAALTAVLLVVVIMVGYYRGSGLLSVAALVLYVLFTMAALAAFDAVLTLPGLAGFVLSIGIAVDANVLIFERIREELGHGKTIRTSIDEGFRHAMTAIVDSNVSTILTAAVLYQFGSGPVKGFAVTLIAGIVASMITAIFVVRTFYLLWLSRARGVQTLSI